ncbi:hypothetical protein PhiBP823_21 [Burkholderia phage PhiBP82.3]|nr:hypothetical protein PhiBP823_21 [Burkholderia phage PhiBP82.3]
MSLALDRRAHASTRRQAGRQPCPSVSVFDSQS